MAAGQGGAPASAGTNRATQDVAVERIEEGLASVGTDIVVYLAKDSAGTSITTTSSQVAAAVNGSQDYGVEDSWLAGLLVNAVNSGSDDGTGVVTALSKQSLTGGTSGAASQTLTQAGQPSNNQTVTVNGRVYTFKTTLTGATDEIKISATNAAHTLVNFINAINRPPAVPITPGVTGVPYALVSGGDGAEGVGYSQGGSPNADVVASSTSGTVATLTAKNVGSAGNALTLTTNATNYTAGGATLSGGGAAAKASYTTSLTGANNDLVFTAENAGLAGNSLTITYVDPGTVPNAKLKVVVNGVGVSGNDEVRQQFDAGLAAGGEVARQVSQIDTQWENSGIDPWAAVKLGNPTKW